jgi:ABC-type uncharacterized transport system substrate-binding protein
LVVEYHTGVEKERRLAFGVLALLVLGGTCSRRREAGAQPRPAAHPVPRVAVVRQPGLRTYEDVADEFRGRVRASVRVVASKPARAETFAAWLDSYRPGLVLAIGQSAHDLVRGVARCPVVSVLAYHRLAAAAGRPHYVVPSTIPPHEVMRALRLVRPRLRSVVLLHGPGTGALADAARSAGRKLGIAVAATSARSPAQAISRLRATAGHGDALWLATDLQLLTPQVFQYALMLQFRHRVPLVGATRRHVLQGALLTLDHGSSTLGREAAAIANQILSASAPAASPQLPVELSVNLTTAARIGADASGLREWASRAYQ